jgi:hypothetical protein
VPRRFECHSTAKQLEQILTSPLQISFGRGAAFAAQAVIRRRSSSSPNASPAPCGIVERAGSVLPVDKSSGSVV